MDHNGSACQIAVNIQKVSHILSCSLLLWRKSWVLGLLFVLVPTLSPPFSVTAASEFLSIIAVKVLDIIKVLKNLEKYTSHEYLYMQLCATNTNILYKLFAKYFGQMMDVLQSTGITESTMDFEDCHTGQKLKLSIIGQDNSCHEFLTNVYTTDLLHNFT